MNQCPRQRVLEKARAGKLVLRIGAFLLTLLKCELIDFSKAQRLHRIQLVALAGGAQCAHFERVVGTKARLGSGIIRIAEAFRRVPQQQFWYGLVLFMRWRSPYLTLRVPEILIHARLPELHASKSQPGESLVCLLESFFQCYRYRHTRCRAVESPILQGRKHL